MSSVNLVNVIGADPDAHTIYHGNHKDRHASLHIKTGGEHFNFDLNNPTHTDWSQQKVKKRDHGKKENIYDKRKEKKNK
jgi:hypothetical protein